MEKVFNFAEGVNSSGNYIMDLSLAAFLIASAGCYNNLVLRALDRVIMLSIDKMPDTRYCPRLSCTTTL